MRNIIIFFITALLSISCEYCPYRDGIIEEDNYGVRYKGDYFCAETLLGTWQCTYPSSVGSIELKQIIFLDGRKCDVTYSEGRDVDWHTETFDYSYHSSTLRFSNYYHSFYYKVDGYIWPELYVKDSSGRHTWRKVRSY